MADKLDLVLHMTDKLDLILNMVRNITIAVSEQNRLLKKYLFRDADTVKKLLDVAVMRKAQIDALKCRVSELENARKLR